MKNYEFKKVIQGEYIKETGRKIFDRNDEYTGSYVSWVERKLWNTRTEPKEQDVCPLEEYTNTDPEKIEAIELGDGKTRVYGGKSEDGTYILGFAKSEEALPVGSELGKHHGLYPNTFFQIISKEPKAMEVVREQADRALNNGYPRTEPKEQGHLAKQWLLTYGKELVDYYRADHKRLHEKPDHKTKEVICSLMNCYDYFHKKEQDGRHVDKIREAFEEIPRKLIQFYENGPFVEVIEGHAADYLEAEIERLKAENKGMRCCGNCGYDETNNPICLRCTRSGLPDVVKDRWQPKENN